MRTTFLAVLLALLVPGSALAGGMATAGIANPPTNVKPGETWPAQLEILQHGRTPMTDLSPAVVVTGPDGKEQRFAARETDKPGIYTANVVFPKAGRYEYRVDDGFTNAIPHTFPAVDIRAPAPATAASPPAARTDGGFPLLPVIGTALAALALAAAAVTLTRRRRGALPA